MLVGGPWTQIMALGSSLGPDVTMTLVSGAGHSDWHGPSGNVALEHQHGPTWWPRAQESTWSSMVTGAPGINIDPGCNRATDPDKAPATAQACKMPWPWV